MNSWNEDTTLECTSNLQSVASGSGIPSIGMIVTLPAIAMPSLASMLVIGGPQVTPISMNGPTLGPIPLGILKVAVVCHLVLCLMRHQAKVEMMKIVEMVAMVVLLGQELYRYNRKEYQPSIWESSPKTLRYSMDGPMKIFQHGWLRSLTSFI